MQKLIGACAVAGALALPGVASAFHIPGATYAGSFSTGIGGTVVLEVNTRRALSREEREADLAEALAFARLHLAAEFSGRR